MNANEIRRLANAINAHRPDWPVSSLTTFITRSLGNRTYQDASVALTWIATDAKPDGTPASEKPARVLEHGNWWKCAELNGTAAVRAQAPTREQACRDCGRWLHQCMCPEPVTRPLPPADPSTRAAAIAAARAALRQGQVPDESLEDA